MRSMTSGLRAGGGWRRARERLCRTCASSGGARRRRGTHFLTQPRERWVASAKSWRVQVGWVCRSARKRVRSAYHWSSISSPPGESSPAKRLDRIGSTQVYDGGKPPGHEVRKQYSKGTGGGSRTCSSGPL